MNYINSEAQDRARKALAFHDSEAGKKYTQQYENGPDQVSDLSTDIILNVSKLRENSKKFIASLIYSS